MANLNLVRNGNYLITAGVWLVSLISLISLSGCDKFPINLNSKKNSSKNGAKENITKEEKAEAQKLRLAIDPTENERAQMQRDVRDMFEVEDFKSLEAMAKDLAQNKERFPDGSWKLSAVYYGIDQREDSSDDGFAYDAQLHKKWAKEFPNSPVQLTAYAQLLATYAWKARGSGYAHTVTPEMREMMLQRLAAARKSLQAALTTKKEDIHWYKVAGRVGLGQGWSKKDFDAIVEVAMEKEPEYDIILHDRAYSLLPRWYGAKGEMEKFASNAADKAGERGDEVYASIVADIYDFYDNIFQESSIDWKRVRRGLEKSMAKYPNAITLKNHAAYLATLARDREFAKKCFEDLGDSYVKWVWKKPDRFIHYRTWARTGKW